MKTKSQGIAIINERFNAGLNNSNTSYSKINKSKEVWWFNVHVSKFVNDVHLLLNMTDSTIWIKLPKGFANGLPFRIREDKNAVDLEISADPSFKYLKDVKSGGNGFDFSKYVKDKFIH
ncbi:hypothetical protein [Gelidibacter japonicus]|uniref:hypothetical protein n=1 Tax=Gelidibacter japonicus TaxID=1962232 RepID=UPI0013D4CEAE|nr:hypothetical protein [Gelidibacter japonicus]